MQVYGDVDLEQTTAALERSFGALTPRTALPAEKAAAPYRVPAGSDQPVVLTHHGDARQSAAMVYWPTGGGTAGLRESRQLRILSEVFSNRLLDALRDIERREAIDLAIDKKAIVDTILFGQGEVAEARYSVLPDALQVIC